MKPKIPIHIPTSIHIKIPSKPTRTSIDFIIAKEASRSHLWTRIGVEIELPTMVEREGRGGTPTQDLSAIRRRRGGRNREKGRGGADGAILHAGEPLCVGRPRGSGVVEPTAPLEHEGKGGQGQGEHREEEDDPRREARARGGRGAGAGGRPERSGETRHRQRSDRLKAERERTQR